MGWLGDENLILFHQLIRQSFNLYQWGKVWKKFVKKKIFADVIIQLWNAKWPIKGFYSDYYQWLSGTDETYFFVPLSKKEHCKISYIAFLDRWHFSDVVIFICLICVFGNIPKRPRGCVKGTIQGHYEIL